MKIARKIEIAEQAVRSISMHDDEDAQLRLAALDRLEATIKAEREAIAKRLQAKIDAATKG